MYVTLITHQLNFMEGIPTSSAGAENTPNNIPQAEQIPDMADSPVTQEEMDSAVKDVSAPDLESTSEKSENLESNERIEAENAFADQEVLNQEAKANEQKIADEARLEELRGELNKEAPIEENKEAVPEENLESGNETIPETIEKVSETGKQYSTGVYEGGGLHVLNGVVISSPVASHEEKVQYGPCEVCKGSGKRFFFFKCRQCGGTGRVKVSKSTKQTFSIR